MSKKQSKVSGKRSGKAKAETKPEVKPAPDWYKEGRGPETPKSQATKKAKAEAPRLNRSVAVIQGLKQIGSGHTIKEIATAANARMGKDGDNLRETEFRTHLIIPALEELGLVRREKRKVYWTGKGK
jgi:hypothetical protein